jgi:hypothetical protein
MSNETNVLDPVQAILAATFGTGIAAEVTATPEVVEEAHVTAHPPEWPTKHDGTPRKKWQRPEVTLGAAGAKAEASELRVVRALLEGAESLVDLQAATGLAKLTVCRALDRLVAAGRVTATKAPPSGRRGRPAHLYRTVVEVLAGQGVE